MNALIYLRVSTKEQASKGESAEGYSIPYDLGSNIIERTYPDGTAVSSSYDDDSRLSSVTSGAKTTSYAYDVAGNLITTALPASNGHVETRTYDRAGRLSEVSNAKGAALLSRFTYVRDAVGNPLSITGLDGVTTYSYDEQDRLTEVCFPLGCAGGVLDRDYIRYTYDDVGNRVTEAKPGATTTYTYDAADRITSSVTGQSTTAYGHDANGNLIAAGSMSYAYDQGNRMISATVGGTAYSYGHDGTGARVTSSSGGVSTQYQWDENNPLPLLVRESGGGNSLIRSYIYGHGLISSHAPNVENYYHYDGIGSVTNVTDSSGLPQWSYGYDAFGNARSTTKVNPLAPDNPMRFTGQYLDPTGLYHLRARQYDPGLGRFTATDPWPAGISDSYVSSYAYVNNRPTLFVDPSGMFCILTSNQDGSCRGSGVVGAVGGAMYHTGKWTWDHKWQIGGATAAGVCIFASAGACGWAVAGLAGLKTTASAIDYRCPKQLAVDTLWNIGSSALLYLPGGAGGNAAATSALGGGNLQYGYRAAMEAPGLGGSLDADFSGPGYPLGVTCGK